MGELVCAFDAFAGFQDLAIQSLGHVDRRLRVPAVQDGERIEAQLAQLRRCRCDRWLAAGEVLRAILEAGGRAAGDGRRGRLCFASPNGGWRDSAAGGLKAHHTGGEQGDEKTASTARRLDQLHCGARAGFFLRFFDVIGR